MSLKRYDTFGSGLNALSFWSNVNDNMINISWNKLSNQPPKLTRHNRTSTVNGADEVPSPHRQKSNG